MEKTDLKTSAEPQYSNDDFSKDFIPAEGTTTNHFLKPMEQESFSDDSSDGDAGDCLIVHSKDGMNVYCEYDSALDTYKCKICQDTRVSEIGMEKHVLEHEVDCLTCPTCSNKHIDLFRYSLHISEHKTTGYFYCGSCNFISGSTLSLHEHISHKHFNQKFTCSVCNAFYYYKVGYLRHMRSHPSFCEKCDKNYETQYDYDEHVKQHDTYCNKCENDFINEFEFGEHRKNEHPLVRKCMICEKDFFYQSSLLKHQLKEHSVEVLPPIFEPIKCSMCPKKFKSQGGFDRHFGTHAMKDKRLCEVCGKTFANEGYLKEHYRIHTGEKPYKCNICETSFRRDTHLKAHVRIHTGEKPYKCKTCDKAFIQITSLKIHERYHMDVKPFVCMLCDKGFIYKEALRVHLNNCTVPDEDEDMEENDGT